MKIFADSATEESCYVVGGLVSLAVINRSNIIKMFYSSLHLHHLINRLQPNHSPRQFLTHVQHQAIPPHTNASIFLGITLYRKSEL